MTQAAIAYGSFYRIFDNTLTTPALVEVAEVIAITPPGGEADRIDATHMQSPNRRREYIAGLLDSGTAEFQINFVPGGPTDLLIRGLQESGAIVQHQIEFPNGITVTFDASITGYAIEMPVDDRMTATITIAPSGGVTWSA